MFQFSEIKAVDLDNLTGSRAKKSEFTTKLLALEVGQGFEVSGMTRGNVASRCNVAGRMNKRSFGTSAIEGGALLVFRKA